VLHSTQERHVNAPESTEDHATMLQPRDQSTSGHSTAPSSSPDPSDVGAQGGSRDFRDPLNALLSREGRSTRSMKRHYRDTVGQSSSELARKRANIHGRPSILKLKIKVEECCACGELARHSDFIEKPTSECTHSGKTCRTCLRNWISTSLDGGQWEKVSCPECQSVLHYSDVQQHADPELFDRSVIIPQ
jgi:hypothetical protein